VGFPDAERFGAAAGSGRLKFGPKPVVVYTGSAHRRSVKI